MRDTVCLCRFAFATDWYIVSAFNTASHYRHELLFLKLAVVFSIFTGKMLWVFNKFPKYRAPYGLALVLFTYSLWGRRYY